MQRKFITSLVFLIFINVLVKPFWIYLDIKVQNIVGAESYGVYFSLMGLSFVFNILLDLGITNYNKRNIAQNSQLLSKHLSGIILIRLMLAVLYGILCFGTGIILGYDSYQLKLLGLLVINQFLLSFLLYLRSNLEALHLFTINSLISVLDRIIMMVLISILIWGNFGFGIISIEWFIIVQLIGYSITTLIALLIVLKKSSLLKLNWNIPFFIMIIKQSFPYAILILLMGFYNRIDSVMLERMLPNGAYQSGIYAQSFRLLDGINMFPYMFSIILLPMFAKMLKQGESIEQLTKMSFSIIIIPAIIFSIGCYFYSEEIIHLLYPKDKIDSVLVFSTIIFSFISICTIYIFGSLLTANGNLKILNFIAAGSMIINIVLNYILIPDLKAYGSAIASVITQFIAAILHIILAAYYFKFKINFILIGKLILFTIFVITIPKILTNITELWILNLLIFSIISLIFALILNIISFKSILHFLKINKT